MIKKTRRGLTEWPAVMVLRKLPKETQARVLNLLQRGIWQHLPMSEQERAYLEELVSRYRGEWDNTHSITQKVALVLHFLTDTEKQRVETIFDREIWDDLPFNYDEERFLNEVVASASEARDV